MSELSDHAKALLREASVEHAPSAQQLRALRDALSVQLGTPVASELAVTKTTLIAKATALKLAALGTVIAASVAVLQPSAPPPRTPPRVPITEPSLITQPPPIEVAPPPQVQAAPRAKRARKRAVPPAIVERVDDLSAEVTLLRNARALLAAGDAAAALQQLDAHQQRFAHGALQEEQLALRALCLCARGEIDAARVSARQLAQQAPHSPQLARLAHSCAAD